MLKIHIAHFPNDTTSVSDLPNLFVLCDRQDWLALQRSMLEEFAAKKESAEALPGVTFVMPTASYVHRLFRIGL